MAWIWVVCCCFCWHCLISAVGWTAESRKCIYTAANKVPSNSAVSSTNAPTKLTLHEIIGRRKKNRTRKIQYTQTTQSERKHNFEWHSSEVNDRQRKFFLFLYFSTRVCHGKLARQWQEEKKKKKKLLYLRWMGRNLNVCVCVCDRSV